MKGNLGSHEIRFGNDFLDQIPKAEAIKIIISELDYIKIKIVSIKGHNKLNEKTNNRLGENVFKSYIRVNIQNI